MINTIRITTMGGNDASSGLGEFRGKQHRNCRTNHVSHQGPYTIDAFHWHIRPPFNRSFGALDPVDLP